jgi:outer membrane protein OmpA-like peptidoglycan-associated protein
MISNVCLTFLLFALQSTPVELTSLTAPTGSRVDVPLSPSGAVEVRRQETITRLKVKVDRLAALSVFGELLRAYVVWAVSPEGTFENLGELRIDGQKAELETTTRLQRFGLLITAEPHFMVDTPYTSVAFRSRPTLDAEVREEEMTVEVGSHDYTGISLPPQGALSPRIVQARMAFKIVEAEQADQLADSQFRQARIAADSLEQLLRRSMPTDVLLPYANDSIRLSQIAVSVARAQPVRIELEKMTSRASRLEGDKEQLQTEVERLRSQGQNLEGRLDDSQSDLQNVRRQNRELELEKEDALRRARASESEIARLSDPWPPLRRALLENGARETSRGLLFTLNEAFDSRKSDLNPAPREILARLVGVLGSTSLVTIRIDGHTDNSGMEDKNLTLSQDRANAVRDFFVAAGISDDVIHAEGFGSSRPIVPNEDDESRAINRRVEIVLRQNR